ncbi:DUF493 family protein [Flavobacterium sp. JP2137]|uniref:DUF493 family protein n=1 Tax=Flavobacterium sp. JP2137 TaxID=3414510 RepID=UPI003D2FED8E
MDTNTEEFYIRLKDELEKDTSWPSEYLFKFIVPSSSEKIATIEASFDGQSAIILTKESSTGKFTSVSIRVVMTSPQFVVDKYVELSSIEGILSL